MSIIPSLCCFAHTEEDVHRSWPRFFPPRLVVLRFRDCPAIHVPRSTFHYSMRICCICREAKGSSRRSRHRLMLPVIVAAEAWPGCSIQSHRWVEPQPCWWGCKRASSVLGTLPTSDVISAGIYIFRSEPQNTSNVKGETARSRH